MNKIKLAFFISNLGQGGAEKQLVELIKNINKNIFDVHLYLYAYQKEMFYQEIFEIRDILIIKNKLKYKNYPFFVFLFAPCFLIYSILLQK